MTLVVTENALNALASLPLSGEWLRQPSAVDELPNLEVHEIEGIEILATDHCDDSARLLVISPKEGNLFELMAIDDRRGVYDRCARIALRAFGQKVSLNPRWLPFHVGNRVSIFALGLGNKERILAEVGVKGSSNVYIFSFGCETEHFELQEIAIDHIPYDKAVAAYIKLATSDRKKNSTEVKGLIELEDLPLSKMAKGFTYSDWYPKLLTKDQKRFVDHEVAGPLRLRGAAGTGKTLAMVLKALKTKYDADARETPVHVLFITHSWAMAEHVDTLLSDLDDRDETVSSIDVFPLLLLANKRDYKEIGRVPLGIDSQDGKMLALKEIANVLERFKAADWFAFRSGCGSDFISRIEADSNSAISKLLCWDLLLEFGCVIAAQGILTHSADKDRYLRVRRMKWMLTLESQTEKEAVFALWKEFMQNLKLKGLIPTDQIISDYLNDLSTFYWEAARRSQGYDVIFVDEMHLFNAQERLIFHNLLSDGDLPPKVIMALDPNQSPRETFTNVIDETKATVSSIYENARLSKPAKIDLIEVFRYTPEIANLISVVHDAAPALDFVEDWDVPRGISAAGTGARPKYHVVADKLETFRYSTELAQQRVKTAKSRDGGHVAILCMDDGRFEDYSRAASKQLETTALIIASRDDTERLKYLGKRVVLSTPEYVAGLQFDTVILVDVNRHQVPDGKNSSFHLRRFLSEMYLGMSRAQNELYIISSKDQGGVPTSLEKAIQLGVLEPLSSCK